VGRLGQVGRGRSRCWAQIVETRKRLCGQIRARQKQGIPASLDEMDADLKAMLDTQLLEIESRIEGAIAREETSARKAELLRSIPGIGPVVAAMLIAELPELGHMTAGEAAAMTGLAPISHDSGTFRGKRSIAGGRRLLRRVLFQAALTAFLGNNASHPFGAARIVFVIGSLLWRERTRLLALRVVLEGRHEIGDDPADRAKGVHASQEPVVIVGRIDRRHLERIGPQIDQQRRF
jgi:transposase